MQNSKQTAYNQNILFRTKTFPKLGANGGGRRRQGVQRARRCCARSVPYTEHEPRCLGILGVPPSQRAATSCVYYAVGRLGAQWGTEVGQQGARSTITARGAAWVTDRRNQPVQTPMKTHERQCSHVGANP